MLAPIVTKDMRLFPSRPLPTGIKNNTCSSAGRIVPVKHRSSVSTGNLTNSSNQPASTQSFRERKPTLMSIKEGEEMFIADENNIRDISYASEPSLRYNSVPNKKLTAIQVAKLEAAKKKSYEQGTSNPKLSLSSSETSKEQNRDELTNGKSSKSRRVVRWIATALHKHNKSSSDTK
ncbi:unnamed protein product [Auanema sp. JU1783]|nr:unnamed protein product [Auanema sp. JU1783]